MNRRTAKSWRTRVFTTFAAAAIATVGALAPAAPGQAIENTFVGFGSNILGMQFEHANFGGKQLLFLSPNVGCTLPLSDVDFQIGGMPEDWNDEVSSFTGFGGAPLTACWSKNFRDSNFRGQTIGFTQTLSFVGDSMNDETTSIQWS